MTEIAFYHMTRSPLETVLPKLLDKTIQAGKRAVVVVGSRQRVEPLVEVLWSYDPGSWLPHGSMQDGHPEHQPVWLTDEDENPNGADFLFLVDGGHSTRVADFERCFEVFDGTSAASVTDARARWSRHKSAGHDLTYWQQTDGGEWRKKGPQ